MKKIFSLLLLAGILTGVSGCVVVPPRGGYYASPGFYVGPGPGYGRWGGGRGYYGGGGRYYR